MAMFNKNHTVLSDKMMDILTNLVQSDPLYLECKGKCMDNAPEYLDKLKATLHVQANERVLLYMDEGVLTRGRNGMITTDLSQQYLEALKGDAANKVIITGHAAQGTPGAGVLDDAYRAANGVNAAGEKIVFKVHMDDDDIHFLCRHTGAKQAILFHSNPEFHEAIKPRMAQEGVLITTLRYPEKLKV